MRVCVRRISNTTLISWIGEWNGENEDKEKEKDDNAKNNGKQSVMTPEFKEDSAIREGSRVKRRRRRMEKTC